MFWIITKGSGKSRNSGNLISVHTEILWLSRNFGPVFSILTKSCARSITRPHFLDTSKHHPPTFSGQLKIPRAWIFLAKLKHTTCPSERWKQYKYVIISCSLFNSTLFLQTESSKSSRKARDNRFAFEEIGLFRSRTVSRHKKMFFPIQLYHCVILLATNLFVVQAWQSSFTGVAMSRKKYWASSWTMRDRSASMAFRVGDRVQVTEDLVYRDMKLKHRQGIVVETWEKCEVDPTCCCAEQVDVNMAVRVDFQQEGGVVFTHYFGEDELALVAKKNEAFDGITCTAFKLEQLERNQKPRSIASFNPNQTEDD